MGPFVVGFVFVFVVPVVYAVFLSFFQQRMVGGTVFAGLANYRRLVADTHFWQSVSRVALFTLVQVPVMLFLAAVLALAIDSMKLHGMKFFRITTFLPYAVPAVVSTLIWGFVYGSKYGLVGSVNSLLGTQWDVFNPRVLLAAIGNINTWEYTGYNMLIFYSALSVIPHSLYEAAAIDGVIFSIIGSFQLFNEPSILQNMVPGNAITTDYTPNMYAYTLSFTGNQSTYAAALAIVMAAITMAIAYTVQVSSLKNTMK